MTLYNWAANVEIQVWFKFGSNVFPGPEPWSNVSARCESVTITRGRPSVRGHFDAGTCMVVCDNRDGFFDPNNSAALHYPNLRVGTPVKVVTVHPGSVERTLFTGSVTRWPLAYPNGGHDAIVEIEVTDWTEILNRALTTATYPTQSSDERISALLDAVNPDFTRNLDVGTVTVDTVDYDNTVLHAIHDAVDVEQGDFYLDATGIPTFRNRVAYSGLTPLETFGPAETLKYSDITLAYDKDFLINEAQVTASNDEVGTASDATSIAEHGPSAVQLNNPAVINGTQAANVAEWIVGRYKDVSVRIVGMTLDPDAFVDLLLPVATLELRDLVRVKVDPPGGGDPLDQVVAIEGIAHEITPESWTTSYQLYPITDFDTGEFWILDTSALNTTTITA